LEVDGWQTIHDTATRDTKLDVHVANLDTVSLRTGGGVDFTWYWPEANRWEGIDAGVRVE
jgi:glucoamylase